MLNLNQQLINLEKLIKSGRFTFALVTLDKSGDAVTNELLVDYSGEKADKPVLYIKREDGTLLPISSKSDELLEELKINIIDVGVERSNNYDTSVWFALKKDTVSEDTTFNSTSVITQFYDTITNNLINYKPFIQHTISNGVEHMLIPYTDSTHVFFNMNTIIGGDKDIKHLEYVINYIVSNINNIKNSLTTDITNLNLLLTTLINNINAKNNLQDIEINNLKQTQTITLSKINQMLTDINTIYNTTEREIRKTTLNIGNDSNYMYPIVIRYDKANIGDAITGFGRHAFDGEIRVTASNATYDVVVSLGDTLMTELYNTNNKGTYSYRHKLKVTPDINSKLQLPIIHAEMYDAFSFVLYVKGGTTLEIWTKYKESLVTNIYTGSVNLGGNSYSPKLMSTIVNSFIQGDNRYDLVFNEFTTTDREIITKDLIIQNKYILGIE